VGAIQFIQLLEPAITAAPTPTTTAAAPATAATISTHFYSPPFLGGVL